MILGAGQTITVYTYQLQQLVVSKHDNCGVVGALKGLAYEQTLMSIATAPLCPPYALYTAVVALGATIAVDIADGETETGRQWEDVGPPIKTLSVVPSYPRGLP